ncbi:MAG TPA: hypothetical protein VGR70_09875 [Stellaceae bacterium]|nr:hypothetical protein [Stellaceae bacterium]
MANRRMPFRQVQRAEIARYVKAQRAAGRHWKELEDLFDRKRWQLYHYVLELERTHDLAKITQQDGCDPPVAA